MHTEQSMQANNNATQNAQYEIEMLLDNQPAALERVLQVVRYRQFQLDGLQMQPDGQDKLTVNLKVSSQHSINILTSQLNKLYDLARLSIQQEMPLKSIA
jgi:acetolactate synthase II small subunit